MSAPRQLALALPYAESFARDDFLTGASNKAALGLIERWPDWPDRALGLVGPEGAGKSHLASIWADIAGARRVSARALGETNLPATLATGALRSSCTMIVSPFGKTRFWAVLGGKVMPAPLSAEAAFRWAVNIQAGRSVTRDALDLGKFLRG